MSQISISKKLLFYATTIVISLTLIEFTARLVEFIYPAPTEFTIEKPKIKAKQDGEYRIFVYGGSTVAGVPVKQFGFVEQLEFWLREIHPGKPLEVYNFAVPGSSSTKVLRTLQNTIIYDPDLLIVMTGHNEFLDFGTHQRLRVLLEDNLALTRVLLRVLRNVRSFLSSRNVVIKSRLTPYDRASKTFREKVRNYPENIRHIIQIAQKKKIPLILNTVASNLADWPPAHHNIEWDHYYDKEYESHVDEAITLINNGSSNKAIERIDKLLKIYHDDAMLLYLLGRANAASGNYDLARTLFARAKDLDPIPLRSPSEFNQTIRTWSKTDEFYMADIERAFQPHATNGLVGFSLFADHVHPSNFGNTVIARELIKVMKSHHLFVDRDLEHWDVNDQLEYFLTRSMLPEKRKEFEIEYLLLNAQGSLVLPFNLEAAKVYLKQTLALDSYDWRVWLTLATVSLIEDRIDDCREELKKAVNLRGKPIGPGDLSDLPYLKAGLENGDIVIKDLQ